jgi:TPR repeat protein
LGELERYWFDRAEQLLASETVTDRQRAEAIALFQCAAEMGHRQAALRFAQCLRYGVGTAPDAAAAQQWFFKASGLLDAKIALADMLFFGEAGASRKREAFRWYQMAAEQGDDAYAMYSAGYCLLHGVGTAADPRGGIRWMREAATRGEVDAQYELGCAYFHGLGIAANPQLAQQWLSAAAQLGHQEAQRFMVEVGIEAGADCATKE